MPKAFTSTPLVAIKLLSMRPILILLASLCFFFVTSNEHPSRGVNCLLLQQQDSVAHSQETKCLNCIRNITSANLDLTKRCDGYYCGPFQITYQYWAEAGKPGNGQGSRDFEKCARDKSCAEQTVRAYFKKFRRDCNNDGLIDCLDMAALHKGGPASCSSDWFYKSRFWLAFNKTTCATMIHETGDLDGGSGSSGANTNTRNHQPIRVQMKNQTLTSECLDCICEAVSGCNTSANNCGSGTVCGPFAISQAYWKDGRRPGASWTGCARTKECSGVTIKNYMEKYKRDCTGDGYVTCEDYAAIHRRGPRACTNSDLFKEQYWIKFLACRANQKPANDANMVRVDEETSDPAGAASLASRGELTPVTSTTTATTTTTTPTTAPATSFVAFASSASNLPPTTMVPPTLSQPTTAKAKPGAALEMMSPYQTNQINYQLNDANNHPMNTTSSSSNNRRETVLHQESPSYEMTSINNDAKEATVLKQSTSRTSLPTTTSIVSPLSTRYEQYPSQNHRRNQHRFPSSPSSVYSVQASNAETAQKMNPTTNNLNTRGTVGASEQPYGPNQQQTTSSFYLQQESSSTTTYKRPVIDYSSLPTIIVSRPLGPIGGRPAGQHPNYILPSLSSTTQTTTSMPTTVRLVALQQSPSTKSQQTADQSTERSTTYALWASTNKQHQSEPTMDETQAPDLQSSHHHQDTQAPITELPESTQTTANMFSASSITMGLASSNENENDYTIPEFQDNSNDRTNFDKVVNGIVGNPEFSKSYPPVPDMILHQQQPQLGDIPNSMGSNKLAASVGTLQHRQSSRNSPSRNHYLPGNVGSKTPLTATTRSNPTRYESDTIVNHSSGEFNDGSGEASSSNSGIKAINTTSLFEKDLNETSRIASECLECICDASSNCDTTVQCISKQREKNRCGLYMISWNQYQESDISLLTSLSLAPGASKEEADEKMYYDCTTDRNCAEKLIHLYIEKHQKDCNNDGKIDCYDIAAIHRVGPENCNSGKFLASQYWKDFNICYATDSTSNSNQPRQTQNS